MIFHCPQCGAELDDDAGDLRCPDHGVISDAAFLAEVDAFNRIGDLG